MDNSTPSSDFTNDDDLLVAHMQRSVTCQMVSTYLDEQEDFHPQVSISLLANVKTWI